MLDGGMSFLSICDEGFSLYCSLAFLAMEINSFRICLKVRALFLWMWFLCLILRQIRLFMKGFIFRPDCYYFLRNMAIQNLINSLDKIIVIVIVINISWIKNCRIPVYIIHAIIDNFKASITIVSNSTLVCILFKSCVFISKRAGECVLQNGDAT